MPLVEEGSPRGSSLKCLARCGGGGGGGTPRHMLHLHPCDPWSSSLCSPLSCNSLFLSLSLSQLSSTDKKNPLSERSAMEFVLSLSFPSLTANPLCQNCLGWSATKTELKTKQDPPGPELIMVLWHHLIYVFIMVIRVCYPGKGLDV